MNRTIVGLAFGVIVVVCCLAGCSRPNGRYTVAGTVTFDGKPVPEGGVAIEPDAAAGNRGPRAEAEIRNGRFQTASSKGAIAGPVIIEAWGADGVETKESPIGMVLFNNYRLKMTLPDKSSTLDIAVPREAAVPPPGERKP
ncbi:MAG: hypothetical protein ACKOK8_01990 [Planctomycetia bacterium]